MSFIMFCCFVKFFGLYFLYTLLLRLRSFYKNFVEKKFLGKKFNEVLDCKWALVTGCTSGIGWKLVEILADLKIGVVCLGRSKEKLNDLKRMLDAKGFS